MVMSLFVLLFFSAMVSGSEVAFFSLSPKLLKTLDDEQSNISESILELIQKPRELLATILIANNFINVTIILLSSVISSNLLLAKDVEIFSFIISGSSVAFFVNVIFITFLILLLGEVIPKVYASKFPLELLRVMVVPLDRVNSFLTRIGATPILVKSTKFFTKDGKDKAQNVTIDDLQHALNLTSKKELEIEGHKIMEGVVKFGNTDVKQIMTPRVKAVFVEVNSSFSDVVKMIRETHFSRIPIFEDSIDTIKGVLYAKDLLPYLAREKMDWVPLMREPFFVPENKKIDDLLKEFQDRKTHIALVVDEYGGVSGLVTLEDVIEEIVGDISDEFDDEDTYYNKIAEDEYVFEGETSLNNMYRALGVDGEGFEEEKGEADSIAGFILEIAGRIPLKGDVIKFRNYGFTIESADSRRIKSVKVKINKLNDE